MKKNILFAIFLLFLLGCTKETIRLGMSAKEIFSLSKEAYEERNYDLAVDGFKKLVFEFPGSELIDESQFFLAESYLGRGDYEDAIIEYRFLIDNFPESPYVDDGNYKLGYAYFKTSPPYYLDQKRTRDALNIINSFIISFPESKNVEEAKEIRSKCLDRLARKELENGRLYLKLGHMESAEIYLKVLLENYSSSIYVEEARFLLAICYKKLDRKEEARMILGELIEENGEYSYKASKELEDIAKDE
jgi:outer membrane protein assembly factor BamD